MENVCAASNCFLLFRTSRGALKSENSKRKQRKTLYWKLYCFIGSVSLFQLHLLALTCLASMETAMGICVFLFQAQLVQGVSLHA